jgi:hypothetical protein
MRRSRSSGWSVVRHVALVWVALLVLAPLPADAAPDDAYIAGYVAAVLERQLNVNPRSLRVNDGVVSVDAADVPRATREQMIATIRSIQGVSRVQIVDTPAAAPPPETPAAAAAAGRPETAAAADATLGFLPPGHLFRSLIADPRWPRFGAAYRYYIESPSARNVAAVSFGETIPIYRGDLGRDGKWGQWEVGLQGGVFSIFDLDSDSFDLINTDFFVAGFLGYRLGNASAIGRVFHQSSHLGDELLLSDSRPNRINLSYEGLDAKLSYDLPFGFRAYGGGGYLFDVDPSNLGRGLAQAGGEWRSPWAFWGDRLRPIAGLDLQWKEENNWHTDLSFRAGIQFESVTVLSRNLQILFEYYKGRSFDGQFFRDPVEYVGIGAYFNF